MLSSGGFECGFNVVDHSTHSPECVRRGSIHDVSTHTDEDTQEENGELTHDHIQHLSQSEVELVECDGWTGMNGTGTVAEVDGEEI